ncbi:MAG: SPOR domain-containing protein, partial [Gammaproteobacteria bacterium]
EEPSQAESADETATAENETTDQSASGSYIYTVYLFSTRSEEAALEANQRFQLAGHDTRIVINEKEEPIRYRIAVSGFTSRESAREFANSIVGTLGIRDTWIGRDRPAAANQSP